MYVGRIVGIGRTSEGNNFATYRVSSRSYPNRSAVIDGNEILIQSKIGAEKENGASPYVAYMCLKVLKDYVVISNGEHTGPIADKILEGYEPQEALVRTLMDMGYERDDYSTPRIAGVIPSVGDHGWLATIRKDGLIVQRVGLKDGEMSYIATYDHDSVKSDQVIETSATTANRLAQEAVSSVGGWTNLEKPVTSAVALWSSDTENKINLAVSDAEWV